MQPSGPPRVGLPQSTPEQQWPIWRHSGPPQNRIPLLLHQKNGPPRLVLVPPFMPPRNPNFNGLRQFPGGYVNPCHYFPRRVKQSGQAKLRPAKSYPKCKISINTSSSNNVSKSNVALIAQKQVANPIKSEAAAHSSGIETNADCNKDSPKIEVPRRLSISKEATCSESNNSTENSGPESTTAIEEITCQSSGIVTNGSKETANSTVSEEATNFISSNKNNATVEFRDNGPKIKTPSKVDKCIKPDETKSLSSKKTDAIVETGNDSQKIQRPGTLPKPLKSAEAKGLINKNATVETTKDGSKVPSQIKVLSKESGSNKSNATDRSTRQTLKKAASSSNEDVIELSRADPELVEKILEDTTLQIDIKGVSTEIRYYGQTAVALLGENDLKDIRYRTRKRKIKIDGNIEIECLFNRHHKEFTYKGVAHRIKLGAPTRELYVDDQWYQYDFKSGPILVKLGNKEVSVSIEGTRPSMKIGTEKRTDLVLGIMNLQIMASKNSTVPIYLDGKPQMFKIEGKPVTLEFTDSFKKVILNGKSCDLKFDGSSKIFKFFGEKFSLRFPEFPKSFRVGHVNIKDMKCDKLEPEEFPLPKLPVPKSSTNETSNDASETFGTDAYISMIMASKTDTSVHQETHPNVSILAAVSSANSAVGSVKNETKNQTLEKTAINSEDEDVYKLLEADPELLEKISKDTMKHHRIDGEFKQIRFYGDTAVTFMNWDNPRDVQFETVTRNVLVDFLKINCSVGVYTEFNFCGETHRIKLGAPTRELYIDDEWYQCEFGGDPITVHLGNKQVWAKIEGSRPQMKISTLKRSDLVLGQTTFDVNPGYKTFPVFLDAKPQKFEIGGKPITLEFTDSFRTVVLNGKSCELEFATWLKPIKFNGKKYFLQFANLPKPFQAGQVRIEGMRDSQPEELIPLSLGSMYSPSSQTFSINETLDSARSPSPYRPLNSENCENHSSKEETTDQADESGGKVTSPVSDQSYSFEAHDSSGSANDRCNQETAGSSKKRRFSDDSQCSQGSMVQIKKRSASATVRTSDPQGNNENESAAVSSKERINNIDEEEYETAREDANNKTGKRKRSCEDWGYKKTRTELFFGHMCEIALGLSDRTINHLEREISSLVYKAEDEEYKLFYV